MTDAELLALRAENVERRARKETATVRLLELEEVA